MSRVVYDYTPSRVEQSLDPGVNGGRDGPLKEHKDPQVNGYDVLTPLTATAGAVLAPSEDVFTVNGSPPVHTEESVGEEMGCTVAEPGSPGEGQISQSGVVQCPNPTEWG